MASTVARVKLRTSIKARAGKGIESAGGHGMSENKNEAGTCNTSTPVIEGDELAALTGQLGSGWSVVSGHHLQKEFGFPDFKSALAFTNRVGETAEALGHHPEIALSWGRVKIEIFTHAVNGLTRSDFVLATAIQKLQD